MDALTLLEQDHQKVKKLMGEIEKTTERGVKTREELFTKLVQELTVHEKIEEQIFYPAVKDAAKTKKLEEIVAESFEEHHFVNVVIAEIKKTPYDAEESGRRSSAWGWRTSSTTRSKRKRGRCSRKCASSSARLSLRTSARRWRS